MTAHVFLQPPDDFCPTMEVAGCFCEYEGRLLYLKRNPDKLEGNRWGIPAGKVEENEKPIEAARRELAEEAGIFASLEQLKTVGSLYVRRPEMDFVFHMFFLQLHAFPLLKVAEEEHTEATWINLAESKELLLVSGAQEALNYFYLWRGNQP